MIDQRRQCATIVVDCILLSEIVVENLCFLLKVSQVYVVFDNRRIVGGFFLLESFLKAFQKCISPRVGSDNKLPSFS